MNVFDLHCDTPYMHMSGLAPAVSEETVRPFLEYTACTALWVDDRAAEPAALYQRFLAASALVPFRHILTLEGFCFAEGPAAVDRIAADGIRAVTLTWNYNNRLAGGCLDDGALTDLGKAVIQRMNALGLLLDLSHINEKSFFPALEASERPFVSHGNLKAVHDCPRNLSDAQAAALAARGGVIGICLYPAFLGDGNVFARVYENIVRAEEMGLKAALGSDFDGADMDPALDTPVKLLDLRDFLTKKGFTDTMLEHFFYKNAAGLFAGLYKTGGVV